MAVNGATPAPARSMNRFLGSAILALSGAGFPLTQLAIARLGRPGAAVVVGVTAALLVRDAALIATGTPRALEPGPARLLWVETVAAAAATGAGVLLLRDPNVTAARERGWAVPRTELVRRVAVGTLFGLRTMRLRIDLAGGSARREPAPLPDHA